MDGLCVLRNHHGNCTIQGNGISRKKCSGIQSDCVFKGKPSNQKLSGQIEHIIAQIKRNVSSVSSVVSAKIASGNNQTATIIFVGKRGKGKSQAMLSILEAYSAKMAVMIEGDPWNIANPAHFFTIENVGIIDVKDILRVLRLMKDPKYMYNAFMLDDAGATMGARDFQSKKNKLINLIFQTCRTKRVLTGITIPDDKGLDKDPREGSDYFGMLEQSQFDFNMSIGKFFEQSKQYRSGDMHYVYLRQNGNPVIRHAFKSPSPGLVAQYEPARAAQADKLFNSSMDKLDVLLEDDEFIDADKKEIQKIKPKKLSIIEIGREVKRDVEAGIYPSFKEGCEARGIKYSTFKANRSNGDLD